LSSNNATPDVPISQAQADQVMMEHLLLQQMSDEKLSGYP
jgi:hypothetical protein